MTETAAERIISGEIKLGSPSGAEMKVLDAYRLTDEYRRQYGEYILKHEFNTPAVRGGINALKEILGISANDEVDIENNKDLLTDLIYTKNVLGYTFSEYITYHFADRPIAERMEFLPETGYTQYFTVLNDNKLFSLFDNKYETYQALKPYYKREAALLQGVEDLQDFLKFYEKFDRFVVKPVTGTSGIGVRIVGKAVSAEPPEEIFGSLISKEPFVCEEMIVSAESLNNIHPKSLNTLRIYTYYDHGSNTEPKIISAQLKSGRGESIVDNGSSGGMSAVIDIQTGIVCTDAGAESGEQFAAHPDSGVVFKGFAIEQWEECVAFSKELAKQFPTMRLIGWDIALSADRGWMVVEGNPRGMFYWVQAVTQTGMKQYFLEQFEWKKHIEKDSFAVLIKGTLFRDKIKALAGDSKNVTAFERAYEMPKYRTMTDANLVSATISSDPIYIWYENGTIYYYTKPQKIYFNNIPSAMFQNLSNLKELDLSDFSTIHSAYFDFMFYGCSSLKILDLSGFETEKVVRMDAMFTGCGELEQINLSSFNTGKVKNMKRMFSGCKKLKELDLSNFDTRLTENMSFMFRNNKALKKLDLSAFDTFRLKEMEGMFTGCDNLEDLDISGFRICEDTNMKDAFNGCDKLDGQELIKNMQQKQ